MFRSRGFSGSSPLAPPRSGCGFWLGRLKQRREDLKAAIVAKKREAARLQKKRKARLSNTSCAASAPASPLRNASSAPAASSSSVVSWKRRSPPADLHRGSSTHSLDRDQDRALFGLPPRSPRRRRNHTARPASAPVEGLAARPSPRWLLGQPLRGTQCQGPAPGDSPTSPSQSGPEVANPGTPPLPRSSSGPSTASWSAPENSINEQFCRIRRYLTGSIPPLGAVSFSPAVRTRLGVQSGEKQGPQLPCVATSRELTAWRTWDFNAACRLAGSPRRLTIQAERNAAARHLDKRLDQALSQDRDRALLQQWRFARQ